MVIGGVFYLLTRFKIIALLVCIGIFYLCANVLFDTWVSERTLRDGDSSQYEFQVTQVIYPKHLEYSRQNPQFTVKGHLTNKGQYMIQRWVLQGKLYDCPLMFSPLDECRYAGQWGTYVDAELAPGQTQNFNKVINFIDSDDTRANLRAVWTITNVVQDMDAKNTPWFEENRRKNDAAHEAYLKL
jgi:hypothetical protein